MSVIIPCYNHGNYLDTAIKSVLDQTYKSHEIIIVDDGSVDNTREVAEKYERVIYVQQANKGLSAARNTGIHHSNGKYLVFLDADDWLFIKGLEVNVEQLQRNPAIAFVSGSHQKVADNGIVLEEEKIAVDSNHYERLLQGNYIGMHATVMYQRWIFENFSFDETLKACEDYDLYLKISRKFPVIHHQENVAAYLIHNSNMSGDIPLMLTTVLAVLYRQKKLLRNEIEKKSLKKGLNVWKQYYCEKVYDKLKNGFSSDRSTNFLELNMLFKYRQTFFFKLVIAKSPMIIKKLKGILSRAYNTSAPVAGKVNLGDFDRTTPFSTQFGYDRGGPVDRYYIENFLEKKKLLIKGRVLEIGDNEYTLRYGGSRITKSDILHIDENNAKATFVGDLSNAPQVPADSFDCIVLTQTLHLIYNYADAVKTCYRILKPGGALLLTVPGISHIAQDEWGKYWMWSFTDASIRQILSEVFPLDNIEVETFGNVLVASAFLYGMGLPEISKQKMDERDPHYQVIISVVAVKPAEYVV